ncbi:glucose PTS transporter subunit IIA [Lactiplantibacillus daoliensis]|uniref:Glucose PTS transporter subunit IIA n=1 Tax=Lactiplantibacillus daoliensis TaxID=2559916 RepID=A0ABW1UEW5_9LACO|nr:PTS glucose transporter subunit IIABC [Lactiplantibacillus daoliensis]
MSESQFSLAAPVSGKLISLKEINDPVFSQGLMGTGFGIIPNTKEVVSPISGEIVMIASSKHAIGLKSPNGAEILIHMGINTVELNGLPFKLDIHEHDIVKKGQLLATVDLTMIREKELDPTVITVITNSKQIVDSLALTGTQANVGETAAIVTKSAISAEPTLSQDAESTLGEQILSAIGGKTNISGLTHCATRLRFTLKNNQLPNDERIKNMAGVLGVARAGGQYQVIIGQNVPTIYQQIIDKIGEPESESSTDTSKNTKWFSRLLDLITGIFTPILPAITGAAMIKTLLIILTLLNVITTKSQTYIILSFVGDTAFSFLPIFLAYTASKKFGLNPFIGMVLGAMLLHPNWTALVAAGKQVHLFGFLPVTLATYTSTVIPIILIIWIASYIDKFAEKISPNAIRFFTQPFLTLLIMVPIAFVFVGPLGFLVGKGLGAVITAIQTKALWLLPLLFGIFAPVFIMTGMHYAVTIPLVLTSIATQGFDMLGIGYLVSNIAQGAAALAVGQKTKDTKLRALAFSSGLTALLGITEPALYGVNLKYKKPFLAVMIGGGVGGLIGGIFGVKRMTFAPTGLTTLPIFIDPKNGGNFIWAIIGSILAFGISYLITLIMIKHDKKLQQQIHSNKETD